MASHQIEALTQALARLPGLGPRSARRAVLHLMKKRQSSLEPLLAALQTVADTLSTCATCGNVDTSDPCSICRDAKRDDRLTEMRPIGNYRAAGVKLLASFSIKRIEHKVADWCGSERGRIGQVGPSSAGRASRGR